MSPRQRLILFDECIGKPHVERLKTLVADVSAIDAKISHVLDFQAQGVRDEDWIPRIANEGWIVISGDRGRGGMKKGEPLPRVCLKYGVTHVLLSRGVVHRCSADKILTVLSVWHEILELHSVPRGSRYHLEPRADMLSQGRLVNRTPPIIPEQVAPPGTLF